MQVDISDLQEVKDTPSRPITMPVVPPKLPSLRPPVPPAPGGARPILAIPPRPPGTVKISPLKPGTMQMPTMRPGMPPMPPSVSIPRPGSAPTAGPPGDDSSSRLRPPTAPPIPSEAPRGRPPTLPPPPVPVGPPGDFATEPSLAAIVGISPSDATASAPSPTTPRHRTPTQDSGRVKRSTFQALSDLGGGLDLGPGPSGLLGEGGVEVGTQTPNIVVDQPLEAYLESPTVLDKALSDLGEMGGEKRAATMARELEATTDPAAAAILAYELGELYERRLADEARAVKSFGRALSLDPSLRPNLWAIRRVFYRRGLWPNLVKLIGAEVTYARDDYERADLLLEKARIAERMGDADEARAALDEAMAIAPQHQGALLELERLVAKSNDNAALLDVWERLAEVAHEPSRKIAYWLEVGRLAGTDAGKRDFARATAAFEQATLLAAGTPLAERVARERLRVAEELGEAADAAAAIEQLASILLASFGPAGLDGADGVTSGDRATSLRRELVALRRRQSQLARQDQPDQAWEILQQAVAMAPGEPVVLADLAELAEELGRYGELAELVQSWQAVEGDPARAMVLSIRRADALLRGGQREQARALLASLEASAPGFVVLTSAAERDAIGRADTKDLATTYLAAAHAALLGSWLGPGQPPAPDPGAAAALYVQAAELLAYDVDRSAELPGGAGSPLEAARDALGKALEAVPNYAPALEALTELDDATGAVAEGLARLDLLAQVATGDQKRAYYERAIRLARSHGHLEAVVELERAVSLIAPDDLALRWRLEVTLAQLGRDEERADLLVAIATAEPDATRRGTALLSAARLRERAGNVEAATDLYRQVLALWPTDTFARESLVDLLRAQERWTDLVAERRAEARTLNDGASARRALREAAWVLEVRLGDTASAAAVYDEWQRRFPDDRTALEGSARCRAQFGDRAGESAARRAIADLDAAPEPQWLLGRALERAGQFDEAADVFRLLSIREEASVAATSAAFALADLAASRVDTVMRVEATAALAGRTTEPRLGAALAEDSGWMYALVLEDFERAAQSFAAATMLEPRRSGALLGAALVAARRGDPVALSVAYDGLADAVKMPEAAAALHLRAAAMAAANGDLELANQRIASARAAAPDDTSALLVIAETVPSAVVEAEAANDAAARAAIVDPLLARAEILEMRSALADDPAARVSWELDRAEALELAGRLREAGTVVVAVLKEMPGELRALAAMRRLAKRAGDEVAWAQASYELARALGDPAAKLGLLRDAASVLDRDGSPPTGLLGLYQRIVQVEPGAPELERVLALLRERADVNGLVTAISDRLAWLESEAQDRARDQQMVPLLLERATVLLGLGDREAATADLDALLERSQSHIEGLRFRAELALEAGDVELAVKLWKQALTTETRQEQRSEIELKLAQVLAENVNDLAGAIENLGHVVDATPSDVGLREKLLALCLRASDWERASAELGALARLRTAPQDKAREELRLALMLRDKLNDRGRAKAALDRARMHDPLNIDVIRELSELVDSNSRLTVLADAASTFRSQIEQTPKTAALYDRLAQVTGWQRDVDARWLALVGFEALGTPTTDQRQVLEQGRAKLSAPSRAELSTASRAILRGDATGPMVELWRAIAPAVQVATGVDPAKLGFVRGDRIALKKLTDKHEPLVNALASFGVTDVELFISESRSGIARVLAAETPILCLGADVAQAETPQQRWLLGRAVATLAEGLGTLPDLREVELGWTLAAAMKACEVAVPAGLAADVAGEDASIAERAKIIKKELSRKAKAAVVQLVQQKGAELKDAAKLRASALAAGNRAGLLWCGDLAVVLAQLDVGKGGKALTESALALVAWSVSSDHVQLRDQTGVAMKGTR